MDKKIPTPAPAPTPEQQDAIDAMVAWYASPPSPFVLKGFAGTGKTFTINQLLKTISGTIIFTAPTNKAVRVLRDFGARPAKTIHQLLGLTVKNRQGRQVLEQKDSPTVSSYRLVVVDEASMISSELFALIEPFLSDTHFLFVGDPAQLPPIGEFSSPTLKLPKAFTLKKGMRQHESGSLSTLCTEIRKRVRVRSPLQISEGSEVQTLSHPKWVRATIDAFALKGDFDQNPDNTRAIAYTNKIVQKMNTAIQQFRYPDLTMAYAIGERITCASPVFGRAVGGGAEIILPTETEGTVKQCERGTDFEGIPTQKVTLTSYPDPIRIVDPAYVNLITQELKKAVQQKNWYQFFKLKESFADLRCAYAMTAHKSQGSTFGTVYIHCSDILSNFNKKEGAQCLYVAISRAQDRVVLNTNRLFT